MSNASEDSRSDKGSGDLLDPSGALAELSAMLASVQSLDGMLEELVALAKDRIPGADDVSLTLIENSRPITASSTSPAAVLMDERQYEAGWGPCLDCISAGHVLAVEDIASETRWPDFVQRAREVGIGSSVSAPLPTQQHLSGGLNVYSFRAHAFGTDSREAAQAFADHASLALAQAYRFTHATRQAESLREAMRSRAVIEQAKGIFMAARRLDADQAFDVLVRLSQTRHVKLRDLAAQIVTEATGHKVRLDQN